MGMREVTYDAFYAHMNNLDVVTSITGPWPYKTRFEYRNRALVGEVVEQLPPGQTHGLPTKKYYLTD